MMNDRQIQTDYRAFSETSSLKAAVTAGVDDCRGGSSLADRWTRDRRDGEPPWPLWKRGQAPADVAYCWGYPIAKHLGNRW